MDTIQHAPSLTLTEKLELADSLRTICEEARGPMQAMAPCGGLENELKRLALEQLSDPQTIKSASIKELSAWLRSLISLNRKEEGTNKNNHNFGAIKSTVAQALFEKIQKTMGTLKDNSKGVKAAA